MGTILIGLALFQLFPEFFLGFFNPDDDLLRVGKPVLRTLSLSFVFAGASVVTTSTFQALGNGVWSLFVFIVRLLIPTLPLAWLLGKLGGLNALWFALPICDLLGLGLAVILMRKMYNKVIKPMIIQDPRQKEDMQSVDMR